MLDAIAQRLGYDPSADDGLAITLLFRRAGRGLEAVLRVGDAPIRRAPRVIRTRRRACDDLARSAALAAAIAIDPLVALRRPSPRPSSPPPPSSESPRRETSAPIASSTPPPPSSSPPPIASSAPPSSAPPVSSPPPPSRPVDASPPRLAVSAALTLSTGLSPALAPGIQLGAAYRWRLASIAVDTRIAYPNAQERFGGAVFVTPATASLAGCVNGPWIVAPFGCALVQASWLIGIGDRFSGGNQSAVVGPVFTLGGRAGVAWTPMRRLNVFVAGEIGWVPAPAQFVVEGGTQPIWVTPGWAAAGILGASLSIW